MKITLFQENLTKALQFVGKTIPGKPQLPILSNILIQAEGGRVLFGATNLEVTSSVWIDAKIEEEGAITVPAKSFLEYITTLSPGTLEITTVDSTLTVTSNENEAQFVTVSASEFPPLPKLQEKPSIELSVDEFCQLLSFTGMSAATDEARPVLTGISVAPGTNETVFAATDGFRLSVVKTNNLISLEAPLIIPARILNEVFQTANNDGQKTIAITVAADKNQIFFSFGDKQITTRLIEGEFPNYQKIIPGSFTTRVVFDHESLLKAVKTTLVFARASSNLIKMKIEKEVTTISANAAQIGTNTTTIHTQSEGEGGEIAFNARFLVDLLSVLKEDQITLEMSGPLAPGVFKSNKNPNLLHIIMPVRVQG